MTQKFKFGDIVKSREYIALLDKPLCFFRYSEKSDWAECLEQDGTFHFLKVEDLELVPHPDTVRLDFIQNSSTEIQFYHTSDEDDDDYDTEWFSLSTPRCDLRETIDETMQEQAP